jgi:hypothetical protein
MSPKRVLGGFGWLVICTILGWQYAEAWYLSWVIQ